jgi:hypothetical protein
MSVAQLTEHPASTMHGAPLELDAPLDVLPELDAAPLWTQPPATHCPSLMAGMSWVAHVAAASAARRAAAAAAPLCLRGEDVILGEIEQEGRRTGSFF